MAKNSVPVAELPALIVSIHGALGGLGKPSQPEVTAEPPKPAVPIKKSITDEYIISLEDGRKLKSMKRYLTGLGMTPADYRAKWGLPHDYPMVAPGLCGETVGAGEKPGSRSQGRAGQPPRQLRKSNPSRRPQMRLPRRQADDRQEGLTASGRLRRR